MNTPTVEISKDRAKIQRQIAALECQLTQDTNEVDRNIHTQALHDLKAAQ